MTIHVQSLPLTVEEVTPDWLETALRVDRPQATFEGISVGDAMFGSATKVFATVESDDPTLPRELCIKGGFVEALRSVSGAGYLNEARFYDQVAVWVPGTPRCHFTATTEEQSQTVLILDDLRAHGASFGAATSPLTVDQAAAVLELLATFHARFWDAANLEHLNELLRGHDALVHIIDILTGREHWANHMSQPKAATVTEVYRDAEAVRRGMRALWALDAQPGPRTLIHGDTHLGNLYFTSDGSPGYLDWQTAGVGVWAHDVATFLGGALTVADRRASEESLLRDYLARVNGSCDAALDWDDAWLSYRQHLLHGFLWVLTPEEMQPEPITAANTRRYSAAVADHDTLGLLKAPVA